MIIGIVGKPSSGKSTFFNALTLMNVPMAAYPFTTIEPNRGVGFVRVECIDKEFNVQCQPRSGYCKNGTRFVPVEMIDVAGLVPGASEGRGKGNAFLDDLRQAHVLIHVVDASGSTNADGEPVEAGSHDPCEDVAFLEKEIDLWFYGIIKKNWHKFSKVGVDTKSKLLTAMAQSLSGLGINEKHIDTALTELNLLEIKLAAWQDEHFMKFASKLRMLSKPIVIAANKMDLPHAKENIEKMKEKFPHLLVVGCSGVAELTLKKAVKDNLVDYLPGADSFKVTGEVNAAQKKGLDYIQKTVFDVYGSTGVQQCLDKAVFDALGYIAIFPGGKKLTDSEGRILPDCYLMPPGSTALDFAYRLHSDIGDNFIRAVNIKTNQMIGKDHELKHRDVIEIIFKK